MGRGVISVTGHIVKDNGPHCAKCQARIVRFPGAHCSACREDARDRKAMGAIVLICLCAALLVIGFMAAHGEWINRN